MTGGLTIFSDGGALQISMGLLIAIISHRVYLAYEPYIYDDDDTLSEIAQTQLVFTFFGCLLLYVEDHTEGERGYATALFGGVLVLVMSAGLLAACYYVLLDTLGAKRLEEEGVVWRDLAVERLSPTRRRSTKAPAERRRSRASSAN